MPSSTPITSTARRVLHNLYSGLPMWDGIQTITPGAGLPAVTTSLIKRGLIEHRSGAFRLTQTGIRTAQELSQ